MFSHLSIRTKIILAQVGLIALVSVFIYNYYPTQQHSAALEAISSKIKSISNMFAIGVGIGLGDTDLVAVSEAMNWADSDSSVVYVSVVDVAGTEIAALNRDNLTIPSELHDAAQATLQQDNAIFYKSPIVYQGQSFGTLVIGYSLKQLDADIASLKATTLYFAISLFVVGFILSVVLANMITTNILRLNAAVEDISKGANQTRMEIKSKDEVGKLAKAFNDMLNSLEKSRQDLLHYSERLKKQNDELQQFSYVVSHDLKAPLRAIFKLSEWIEEDMGAALDDGVRNNLKTLRGRVFRLEGLINGLLEYSKIGRANVADEKTDVHVMVREVLDLLNPPRNFKIEIPVRLPTLTTKRILLQQVWINLISNAIKYNDKPQGIIHIGASEKADHFEFTIQDNGIGIDKTYHEKIFLIFQTLEARDKVEGTGIGLAIVKKSIEDMGGTIKVESEPAQWTRFTLTWPKVRIVRKIDPKNEIHQTI
jgi:signal transduction histidine kinase